MSPFGRVLYWTQMHCSPLTAYPHDCPQRPPMCPKESRPPHRQNCSSIFANCLSCGPLFQRHRAACMSVYNWDGQGNPPMCTEECVAANKAVETLPNAKELACCDCGEGSYGMECRRTRMKFEAACGKSEIECDDTTDKVSCAPLSKHGGATCRVCPCTLVYRPVL